NVCCNQPCQQTCTSDGQFGAYNDAQTTPSCSTGACTNPPVQCPNPGKAIFGAAEPFLCTGNACFNTCHCKCRNAAGAQTTTMCAKQADCTSVNSSWSCPSQCPGSSESPECPPGAAAPSNCHPNGPNNPGPAACVAG